MAERPVNQHSDVVCPGVGKDRGFDVSTEQVVWRLQRFDGQGLAELIHLVGVEVGHSDVTDLSRGHQFIQRACRHLEGGVGIGPVDLVEVDVVAAEGLEAFLDSLPNPFRARVTVGATGVIGWPKAAFGGDDELIARPPLQGAGQQSLRGAKAIALSRVEKVDALIGRVPDGGDSRVFVGRAPFTAELPGSKCDARNLEVGASKSDLLHASTLLVSERRLHLAGDQ